MAKAKRKQKLKVFRTPIGFHDAYVAAASQKAALGAWGTDTNLFARGSAEQVTDPELMKVPLEHPGQVVKVLRGTKAEQIAALKEQEPERSEKSRGSRTAKAEVVPKKAKKRAAKPSRSTLGKAEAALEKLEERQSEQIEEIDAELKALERKRKELARRHERERDEAQERVESEREKYQTALARYEAG